MSTKVTILWDFPKSYRGDLNCGHCQQPLKAQVDAIWEQHSCRLPDKTQRQRIFHHSCSMLKNECPACSKTCDLPEKGAAITLAKDSPELNECARAIKEAADQNNALKAQRAYARVFYSYNAQTTQRLITKLFELTDSEAAFSRSVSHVIEYILLMRYRESYPKKTNPSHFSVNDQDLSILQYCDWLRALRHPDFATWFDGTTISTDNKPDSALSCALTISNRLRKILQEQRTEKMNERHQAFDWGACFRLDPFYALPKAAVQLDEEGQALLARDPQKSLSIIACVTNRYFLHLPQVYYSDAVEMNANPCLVGKFAPPSLMEEHVLLECFRVVQQAIQYNCFDLARCVIDYAFFQPRLFLLGNHTMSFCEPPFFACLEISINKGCFQSLQLLLHTFFSRVSVLLAQHPVELLNMFKTEFIKVGVFVAERVENHPIEAQHLLQVFDSLNGLSVVAKRQLFCLLAQGCISRKDLLVANQILIPPLGERMEKGSEPFHNLFETAFLYGNLTTIHSLLFHQEEVFSDVLKVSREQSAACLERFLCHPKFNPLATAASIRGPISLDTIIHALKEQQDVLPLFWSIFIAHAGKQGRSNDCAGALLELKQKVPAENITSLIEGVLFRIIYLPYDEIQYLSGIVESVRLVLSHGQPSPRFRELLINYILSEIRKVPPGSIQPERLLLPLLNLLVVKGTFSKDTATQALFFVARNWAQHPSHSLAIGKIFLENLGPTRKR